MISRILSVLCYWMAGFVVNFDIWVNSVTLGWIIFLTARIVSLIDNRFSVWHSFIFAGLAFTLFVSSTTFFFSLPETTSRQAFLAFVILLCVTVIVDIVVGDLPASVDWFYALLPVLPASHTRFGKHRNVEASAFILLGVGQVASVSGDVAVVVAAGAIALIGGNANNMVRMPKAKIAGSVRSRRQQLFQ
jgi:hypothetical protein